MKFSTKEDIEAPIAHVFAALSDFRDLERQMLRRGNEFRRLDPDAPVGVGAAWEVRFQFRGRQRQMRATITAFEAPERYTLGAVSDGMVVTAVVDLTALSSERTRLALSVTAVPQTMGARILLQSLKLGKSGMDKAFRQRIASYARTVEEDFDGTVA